MSLGRWAEKHAAGGGWVRRMFGEGVRLRAAHGADAVADLSLGQPLAEPSAAVRSALAQAAAERGRERFGYLPHLGAADTRERVAAELGGGSATGDAVVITAGAANALILALRAFAGSGDEVVGVVPFFAEYSLYCRVIGARFQAVAGGPSGALDLEAIAGRLGAGTRALILNSPNNPSGRVITDAEYAELATLLELHRRTTGVTVLVLVDAVYERLVYTAAPPGRVFDHWEHSAVAHSFSKDLGLAGERIGYLALHPTLATPATLAALAVCQRALGFVNASATMQRMLVHLTDWGVDVEAHRTLRDLAVRRVREAGLTVRAPDGGLYLWVEAPDGDALAYVEELAASHLVLTVPGVAFGMPDHLRLCIAAGAPAIERFGRAALAMREGAAAG